MIRSVTSPEDAEVGDAGVMTTGHELTAEARAEIYLAVLRGTGRHLEKLQKIIEFHNF